MPHVYVPWSSQMAQDSVSPGEASANVCFLFRDASLKSLRGRPSTHSTSAAPLLGWDQPMGLGWCRTPSWPSLCVVSGHACCLGGLPCLLSPILCYFQVPSAICIPMLGHFLECISGQWGLTGRGLGAKCPTPGPQGQQLLCSLTKRRLPRTVAP